MTLTWQIGSDVEPDAASWAAFVPSTKVRTERTPGRKPVIGQKVMDALRDGCTTTKAIADATGLTQTVVGQALHSLRRNRFVVAYGSGRSTTWSAA